VILENRRKPAAETEGRLAAHISNGARFIMSLSGEELDRFGWRKPKRSKANGDCVEAAIASGAVVIRDSKDPQGATLRYSSDSWRSFLSAARAGRFDMFRH
jgi:hypothetical protein